LQPDRDLTGEFSHEIPHRRHAKSHDEHVHAAPDHAAAGEDAPRGTHAKVRQHRENERDPDRCRALAEEERATGMNAFSETLCAASWRSAE
jgi:hypothetical protein